MIALGLRLTLAGGREAAARLVMIAAAVMIGVGMLLTTLAGIDGVNSQNARYAWLETGGVAAPAPPVAAGATPSVTTTPTDPLWWRVIGDSFDGQTVGRVDVAATGPRSPLPPGLHRLPGPGQFYVSPAMGRLLRATPFAELGARYPGHQIGTIGSAALPAPNSLIIVIGRTVAQMQTLPDAQKVTAINTTAPSDCGGCGVGVGINARGIDLILAVVSGALLFPVLIFIGSATRLSAARREQRFAAMRLVGATPRQISVIATVESSVAALVGAALGFGLFFALRPAVARIPFAGAPFFTQDLSLTVADVLAVVIGVPLAAAIAARVALRRVQISPLGVTRRVTPRPPRARRLGLLFAGVAELGYLLVAGPPNTSAGQALAYLAGMVMIMSGLIVAGPWLTMIGSRVIARRTNRPETLIAGRRLADNPQAGFRAISGLVLALFVASVSVGVITTFVANRGLPKGGPAAHGTLRKQFFSHPTSGQPVPAVPSVPAAMTADLRAVDGVRGVALIRADSTGEIGPGLVACAELARVRTEGRCAPGAQVARVGDNLDNDSSLAARVWPASDVSLGALAALPVQSLVIGTDGSTRAIEASRTVLENFYPDPIVPATIGEFSADASRETSEYQRLADVVILASLPIAGCSLAVSVAAGLSERKRPFSMLRLAGVPLARLRRVVALESVVPLLAGAVVSIAAGFVAAQLFLESQLGYSLAAPGLEYYVTVVAGLIASLGIIASTMPLLTRITGPETARNE